MWGLEIGPARMAFPGISLDTVRHVARTVEGSFPMPRPVERNGSEAAPSGMTGDDDSAADPSWRSLASRRPRSRVPPAGGRPAARRNESP